MTNFGGKSMSKVGSETSENKFNLDEASRKELEKSNDSNKGIALEDGPIDQNRKVEEV